MFPDKSACLVTLRLFRDNPTPRQAQISTREKNKNTLAKTTYRSVLVRHHKRRDDTKEKFHSVKRTDRTKKIVQNFAKKQNQANSKNPQLHKANFASTSQKHHIGKSQFKHNSLRIIKKQNPSSNPCIESDVQTFKGVQTYDKFKKYNATIYRVF